MINNRYGYSQISSRPRKPNALTQAEIQRAYRARLAAAGKAVRVVHVGDIPELDSETHFVAERAFFEELRLNYHNALVKMESSEEDRTRLDKRNAYLESELKRLERIHTNALKEIISLKQALAKKHGGTA
ncbi:hypothetical protein [Rhizobium rhizogenes]|uniref:hypothetical protein n=1 Tax=Rhizobium rhizogenes TaxID=359 RepID=UPI001573AF32|nr:hypothetical protein [Rhizobium rhizogenes]NTF72587.1 hypothetical protein [Rhizobium rhizogenes]